MKSFILASSSPRRIEILKNLNLEFHVVPSEYEEKIENNISPEKTVMHLAKNKAIDVYYKVGKNKIIIAADTVVYCDNKILGKPGNQEEAYAMLKGLSNKEHKVLTGICIVNGNLDSIVEDFEETIVEFKDLSESEIINYIRTGEPMDKAGAYGIQGYGGLFVKKIHGCYFNVVGLPVHKLYTMMGKLGVNLLSKDVQNG
jgi:septum formation protein